MKRLVVTAALALSLCLQVVIPMRYLTNPSLPGTPADYIKALGETGVKVMAINPGDMVEF